MADLRISDAPLLQFYQINDFVKLPTGGEGNYSLQLRDLAWYIIADNALADRLYVNQSVSTVNSALQAHITDKANPHQVTKAQVGLDQVDNTADLDKPVSNAVNSAIITAVDGLATHAYVDSSVAHKADKTYVDSQDDLKANKATTLSGYGITDTYTKTETDTKIANKTVNSLSVDSNDVLSLKLVDNTTKSVDLTSVFDNGVAKGIDDVNVKVQQPFTGALSRTQHDKNLEFISVKDFGAKGDGITNDTAALTAAFNSGSAIDLLDGFTYLYDQITVNSDIVLRGKSTLKYSGVAATQTHNGLESTSLVFTRSVLAEHLSLFTDGTSDQIYNLASFTGDNIHIGHLSATSPTQRNQRGGTSFFGSNIHIHNAEFNNIARPMAFTNEYIGGDLNVWRSNIHIGKVTIKNYLRGIKFRYVDGISLGVAHITGAWNGVSISPGYNGVLIETVTNMNVGDVYISDSIEHGWRFGGDGLDTSNWQISSLYIKNTTGCGLKLAPTPPYKVTHGTIGTLTVYDAGKGSLAGNTEGVRLSSIDNISIGSVDILYRGSKGITLSDVTNLRIGRVYAENMAARILQFDMGQDSTVGNSANIHIGTLIGSTQSTARNAIGLDTVGTRTIDNIRIDNAYVTGYNYAAIGAVGANITNAVVNITISDTDIARVLEGTTTEITGTFTKSDGTYYGAAIRAYTRATIVVDSPTFSQDNNTENSGLFISSQQAIAGQGNYGGWQGFSRLASSRRGAAIAIGQTGDTEAKNGLAFFTQNNTKSANEALQLTMLLKHNGTVNLPQLPKTSVGLVSGDLWNDAGTLKVVL